MLIISFFIISLCILIHCLSNCCLCTAAALSVQISPQCGIMKSLFFFFFFIWEEDKRETNVCTVTPGSPALLAPAGLLLASQSDCKHYNMTPGGQLGGAGGVLFIYRCLFVRDHQQKEKQCQAEKRSLQLPNSDPLQQQAAHEEEEGTHEGGQRRTKSAEKPQRRLAW